MSRFFSIVAIASVLLLPACGRPYKDDGRFAGFTRIRSAGSQGLVALNRGLDEVFADFQLYKGGLALFAVPTSEAVVFATDQNALGLGGRRLFSGASELSGTSTKDWVIPNATYKFAMVGYNSGSLAGTPICALALEGGNPEIVLSGGVKTLSFTGGSCTASSAFKDSNDYSSFSIAVCSEATDISSLSHTQGCVGGAPGSGVAAIKVLVTGVDEFSGPNFAVLDPATGAQGMGTSCITLTSGISDSPVNFVGGHPGQGVNLRAEIGLFSDASCASFVGMFQFREGFSGALNTAAADVVRKIGTGGAVVSSLSARWVENASQPRLFVKVP